MLLKSRSNLNSGSKQLIKSRSSDNLPTSQSQVNIQMMSHTLTIREVGCKPQSNWIITLSQSTRWGKENIKLVKYSHNLYTNITKGSLELHRIYYSFLQSSVQTHLVFRFSKIPYIETGLFTLCSHSTAHTIPYSNYNIYNIILYHSTNYGITVQDLLLIYCVFCSFNNNHNAQQQQPTTNNLQPTTTTTNEIPQLNFWKYLKNKTRSCTLRAVAIWYGAKIKIIVYIHTYILYILLYIYIHIYDG